MFGQDEHVPIYPISLGARINTLPHFPTASDDEIFPTEFALVHILWGVFINELDKMALYHFSWLIIASAFVLHNFHGD